MRYAWNVESWLRLQITLKRRITPVKPKESGKTDKFNLFCLTAATEGTLLQRTDISTDRMEITQIIPKISLKKPNKESDDQQLIKDAVKRLIDCAIVKDYIKEHARWNLSSFEVPSENCIWKTKKHEQWLIKLYRSYISCKKNDKAGWCLVLGRGWIPVKRWH